MNRIFIEAKHKNTSEYYFLKAILDRYFPEKMVEFIFMDGVGNLFKEANMNIIAQAQIMGEPVLVFVDADTKEKKQGYEKRKNEIEKGFLQYKCLFPLFIYPNNQSDGDVETLMASAARRDRHKVFFDCFEDYEKCVSGVKDELGNSIYNIPNLKGKLHTYVSAQKLSGTSKRNLNAGDWLFDKDEFWNLDVPELQPLKDFLAAYLV